MPNQVLRHETLQSKHTPPLQDCAEFYINKVKTYQSQQDEIKERDVYIVNVLLNIFSDIQGSKLNSDQSEISNMNLNLCLALEKHILLLMLLHGWRYWLILEVEKKGNAEMNDTQILLERDMITDKLRWILNMGEAV